MKFFKRFIFGFFLLFSLACIIGGANMFYKSYDLKQHGVRAKAVLTGYDSERVTNSTKSGKRYRGSEIYYTKIYKYRVGSDTLTASPKSSSKDITQEEGAIEDVVYRADEPTYVAEVRSLDENIAVSFIPIILGLLVLTLTLYIPYRLRKLKR